MVQEEIARRSEQNACFGRRKNFSANHPFSKIVFCADCGEEFRRIHWNNRGKKSIVWRCLTRLKQKDQCHARTVNEETLIEAFLDALNEIVGNSDQRSTPGKCRSTGGENGKAATGADRQNRAP